MVALCLKLEDEFLCLSASHNLNAKKCRDYKQEGGQKFEANGSTRYHITLWNKVGSGRTPWYIDGLIHSVSGGSPTLSHFDDSNTPMQTLYYCITEAYPVLKHWWVVYAIILLCWSTACFITLLGFTQQFYIAELYRIPIHFWGIPNLVTLQGNSQKLIHCWAIPNPNILLRYSLSQNNAEQFPISKHTELYPILTHCWGIPYPNTLLSNSQTLIHCWAIRNPNTSLRYSLSQNNEQFPISKHTELYPILTHCWGIPYPNTLLSNSQTLIHCWAIRNPNTSLRYSLS